MENQDLVQQSKTDPVSPNAHGTGQPRSENGKDGVLKGPVNVLYDLGSSPGPNQSLEAEAGGLSTGISHIHCKLSYILGTF